MSQPDNAQCHTHERHRPEETPLYQIVETHYPEFLARLEAEGGSVPHFVQQEFDDYLKCGLLERGFLRVKCTGGVQRVSISGAAPPTPISLSIPPSSWIGLFFYASVSCRELLIARSNSHIQLPGIDQLSESPSFFHDLFRSGGVN